MAHVFVVASDTGEHWTIVMPDGRARRGAAFAGSPQVGSLLGKYRICVELASGGMSTVFLARVQDGVGHHRFVALKCLKPRLADDTTYAAMFLDEARVASMIHHPHVCDVLDFRVQGGISYMAMELLDGQTLAAVLHRMSRLGEAWTPARIISVIARIIGDAAEGLHHAHELTDLRGEPLGVVHRDISPENVFLTYDGVVKVMDFGVAVTSQQRHHTAPGIFKGKYSYVAPEVLRGGKPDRRVDVWGLGVIMWELIAGRRLFAIDNEVDMLRAVVDMTIPPPSQLRPGIPPAVDDIVLCALERDPARRFATARDLAYRLTCMLAEERISAGLPDLADFIAHLFPNGRTCAQQMRYTVERMDAADLRDDGTEHPTVASPLSRPALPSVAAPTPTLAPRATPTDQVTPVRTAGGLLGGRWPWAAASALAVAGTAIAVLAYRPGMRGDPDAAAPRALAAEARPLRAHARQAATPACTPDAPDPAAAGDPRLVELEPVQLVSGEVVYRLKPVARDTTPAPGSSSALTIP